MGVLVTIIGAALVQVILDADDAGDTVGHTRRRLNIAVLIAVIVIDLWGVGFPFWALYRAALGPVSSGLVTGVFFSTLASGIASVLLPFYVVISVRSVRYWYKLIRLGLLRGDERATEIRNLVVEGDYLSAAEYDELMQKARTKTIDYPSAVTLLEALSKALILGKPKGIASLFRSGMYLYLRTIMVPAYARRLTSGSGQSV